MKVVSCIVFLTCAVDAGSAIAAGVDFSKKISAAFDQVKELRVVRNQVFESNYPGIECFDVSRVDADEKAGLFCLSRNPQFIQDMGVSEFDSLPGASRPKIRPSSGLVVSTPMGQYAMRLMPGTQRQVAEATVDCDTEAGPIYRATATCNVAVTPLSSQEVLYSNFVVTENATGRVGLTLARIQQIWRRIYPN